jgi:hypothetical protein
VKYFLANVKKNFASMKKGCIFAADLSAQN